MGFVNRHLGLTVSDQGKMLAAVGYPSLESLMDGAVPPAVRSEPESSLPAATTEQEVRDELEALAAGNSVRISMVGMGYHGTRTPAVIKRNLIENPAWYTAYTPYQPEISQGRLEMALVFQTVVADLTALPIANASLLDGATAAAEGMALAHRARAADRSTFVVDNGVHPNVLAVLRTRAAAVGIELDIVSGIRLLAEAAARDTCFGVLVSYPTSLGEIRDYTTVVDEAHQSGSLVIASCDLLALTLLRPPAGWGADVAVGTAQRFGTPMSGGGPHAAFIAVRHGLERQLPGRLVGVTKDDAGRIAYRLTLATREQHIRRERATSNICTAQALHANVSAAYAAYHGPDGLRKIAERIHSLASRLAAGLVDAGASVAYEPIFDTVVATVPGRAGDCVAALAAEGIDVRQVDGNRFAAAVDETTSDATCRVFIAAVRTALGTPPLALGEPVDSDETDRRWAIPNTHRRDTPYLVHDSFHLYRTETEMTRWLRRLADADYALDRGMIPLGSCTMKLNSAISMEPITWPAFADVHPLAPPQTLDGYRTLIDRLERWLAELTGYDAVSIQPNAGSQGELAGLLAIRAYQREHRTPGGAERDVCLVPTSAHGTNAASAVLAGMRVVPVQCEASGGVDLEDLRRQIVDQEERLSAVMVTYPSTFGVYDETIGDVCALVHDAGGQVYVDGANLNALLGYVCPGKIGADVSHLNLHKTFAVPHGGGGPGVGPVAVRKHLAPYLPRLDIPGSDVGWRVDPATNHVGPVAGAPWGNAGVLPIAYAYLRLMGLSGLRAATSNAVLAANYVAHRLAPSYPLLYRGRNGLVAHECILDLREITRRTGVTAEDVAKRLIDYGFHAPTVSFPVVGTFMIEPTESESLPELDRFCDAMIQIRNEIDQVAAGEYPLAESPLRRAPHTAAGLVRDWDRPYTRSTAVYPLAETVSEGGRGHSVPRKYWPPVGRIDAAAGDRNLACTCTQ